MNTQILTFLLIVLECSWNVRSIEQPTEKIRVGAEVLLSTKYEAFLGVKKLGVIANPTSILPSTMEHIVDRMHKDDIQGLLPVELTAVFGPEHGFRGDHQAGSGGAKPRQHQGNTGPRGTTR